MTAPTLAARVAAVVAAGVAWLDEHDPTWWREDATPVTTLHDSEPIDLDRLDLNDPCGCILGHRWGHYGHAMVDAPLDGLSPVDLGFSSGNFIPDGWRREYAALTAEWRRVIRERREAVTGRG